MPTLDAGGQGQTLTLGSSQNSSDATADLFPPIQLGATGFAGANTPTSATSGNMFPFGGFARVGDVLQVPFIGAYTVRLLDATDVQFTEMNSVSMDSAYATDKMSNNNAREHIGRFVPVPPDRDIGTVNATAPTEFFSYYDWCKDIFDHFTVFAPYDDHFPNINPAPRQGGTSSTRYPDWTKKATSPYPITMNPLVPDQTVEQQVEGLVNINTAPWRVLATVPWCSPVSGTNWGGNWEDHNLNIAKSIVIHRQLKGPFKSIMDLQDVEIIGQPGTGTAKGLRFFQYIDHMMKGVDPDDTLGDMSPPHPKNATGNPATPDAIRNDFEEYTLMLNRVSNLITTRSDSFTAYICLQQWENAGTPDARMVSQRRYAVLLDRSGIIKDKKDVKVSYVPID